MLDNTKFSTTEPEIINRMLFHPDFVKCRPKTNYYHSFHHKKFGVKLSLDFRKSVENGKVVGYGYLEINVSPHYHFNQYRHNGNDFTPYDCIKTIFEILNYLGIEQGEYNELKVVNIEFGLNIILKTYIKNLINGLYLYKRKRFKTPEQIKKPLYKESDTSKEKTIKAYAKGIQCHEVLNAPEIDINTFRFEVKHKKSRPIKSMLKKQTVTALDLLELETYKIFSQELINEWEQILLINLEPNLNGLQSEQMQFITDAKKVDFWENIIAENHRNTFGENKKKYYKILKGKNNLHTQIKLQIIDKLYKFSECANSPQKTPINKGKVCFDEIPSQLIKCENAHFSKCTVTGLDISIQREGLPYLKREGLRHLYRTNKRRFYQIRDRFMPLEFITKSLEEQIVRIESNIRHTYDNKALCQRLMQERNYHPNQLQFNFVQ